MDYPELAAQSMGFRAGEPHTIRVSADGARVYFLRSAGPEDQVDRLWFLDVATGMERLVFDPTQVRSGRPEGSGGWDDSLAGWDDTLAGWDDTLAGRDDTLAGRDDTLAGCDERTAGCDHTRRIGSYAIDPLGDVAALALDGELVVATAGQPATIACAAAQPVADPRPDPTGRRVAYVTSGTLHVLDLTTGDDMLLAADADNADVSWGVADLVSAEEFGRRRGYWWSPDGRSVLATRVDTSRVRRWHVSDPAAPDQPGSSVAYPVAGTPNAEVTLHLLDLDGGWVDVHWDRETYPYLVSVSWSQVGGPLVAVLRRLQQHGLVLAVDPRTGETQVHAELADPRWVDPVAGSPCYLADGRVLIGGELAHDGYDARCLFADGGLLTPASLYVRRICGRSGPDLLVEASDGEPSEQHLYRVSTQSAGAGVEVRRLTHSAGWHVGHVGGDTHVVGTASLDHAGTRWTVYSRGAQVVQLRSLAPAPLYAPRPMLERVTDRRLPTGVLYPRAHVAGRRLPVLVDVHCGPGRQEVLATQATWLERQWWADAGFVVVVVDNRGTPGVAPSFEKVIHRRLADVILADQVDAIGALAGKHSDLDLSRIAIRGSFFGGWLAALGALRRPDVYRCAIAIAPVSDWTLYDTAYAERYLGLPSDAGDIYTHNSLLAAAAEPFMTPSEARPLLLLHGMADTRIVAAHTMRLSAALVGSGRPHSVIPLAGTTQTAAATGPVLALQLDFLRRNLG